MVYLGPIQPRPVSVKVPSRPTTTTAVTPYANENQQQPSAGLGAIGPPGGVERRKGDRRSKSDQTIVETRAGRDRRHSPATSVNISI
ncbi:hypothetical protein [Cellvibrio fontiphilus]|jgi:hypothetical protein|uniref:Uncharacterized protein n=1 Tax=Cellvibrio fontiphilus TaxID=1815559 RepID=A0ABV7FCY6_9GAMM